MIFKLVTPIPNVSGLAVDAAVGQARDCGPAQRKRHRHGLGDLAHRVVGRSGDIEIAGGIEAQAAGIDDPETKGVQPPAGVTLVTVLLRPLAT